MVMALCPMQSQRLKLGRPGSRICSQSQTLMTHMAGTYRLSQMLRHPQLELGPLL